METQTTRGLTIGLCGEVVLDAGVTRGVDVFGIDHPLGAVAPLLREADARLCDLAGAPGAHPSGVEVIRRAGFEAVSVANDHALDRGTGGLVETLAALDAAGVGHGGAGADLAAAERPVRLLRSGWRLSVLTFATHPAAWAAGPTTPGIRYVPLDTPGRARACECSRAASGTATPRRAWRRWWMQTLGARRPGWRAPARATRRSELGADLWRACETATHVRWPFDRVRRTAS